MCPDQVSPTVTPRDSIHLHPVLQCTGGAQSATRCAQSATGRAPGSGSSGSSGSFSAIRWLRWLGGRAEANEANEAAGESAKTEALEPQVGLG